MSRPPAPDHRKLAKIKHGTTSGWRYHRLDPELYGPVRECRPCMDAWNTYRRGLVAQRRRHREQLRSLLKYVAVGALNDTLVRPLTDKELDAVVRALRIVDDQLKVLEDAGIPKPEPRKGRR